MSPMDLLLGAARGAVILALALAAMPLLRRRSAEARRLVLALSLGAAAIVPVLSRVAPDLRVLPAAPIAMTTPFAEPIGEEGTPPSVGPTDKSPRPASVAESGPARQGSSWRPVSPAKVAVWIWALGALVVLARLGTGVLGARRLARRARRIEADPAVERRIEMACREAGVRAEVRVSDDIDAPAMTGIWRPVVLVPRSAEGWTLARWTAVLRHELSHAAQRDCLAFVAAQVACAVHWFDPLVWIAARRLLAERELAADEQVLSAGTRATEYAEHLLAIATSAAGRRVPAGALGMASRSQLAARVEAIVRPGAGAVRRSKFRAIGIAAAVGSLLVVVACASPGPGPEVASPASTSLPAGTKEAPVTGSLADRVAARMGAPKGRVELTIRPEIQAIVDEEMKRLADERHPITSAAVVMDPSNGEVLALFDPDAAASPRVTGSTMKPLLVAAALEEKAVTPADRFPCDHGSRSYGPLALRDAGSYDELSVTEIVTVSSNIGASRVFDKLGGAPLVRYLRKLHFGDASAIPLAGGPIEPVPATIEDGSFQGALIAGGEALSMASPLHLAAAYASLFNHGVYNKPALARRVLGADGKATFEHAPENERVFRAETTAAVTAMLERVVYDDKGTGKAARVDGARVAGKTGTADAKTPDGKDAYYASFVGAVPVESPRFVILVGALVAADDATGGKVSAPVFARIAARALSH